MALTLIAEDGTGKADANAYADDADGDEYHEGHIYATAWTGATLAKKEAALVMATRLIDSLMQFGGTKESSEQALQWPRVGCLDRDGAAGASGPALVPTGTVPKVVLDATCETARALIIEDRTANPMGEGLKFSTLGDLQQSFDKADRRPMIPRLALEMLRRVGYEQARGSGSVRLVRT